MMLFIVVVLILAFFPVLLDCARASKRTIQVPSAHFTLTNPPTALYPTRPYPTKILTLSNTLNTGSARVEVPATVDPAHPNNRGFSASTVSISTAVHVTSNQSVATIAKAATHLSPAQLWTHYVHILQWLEIQRMRFIGGVIATCQYLLFVTIGSALLRNQITRGLALQSEPVVVPVPVGPAGPVVECRVPSTRAPVPPATLPLRPLVRRPLLNPTIPRLGGSQNTPPAPQPVAPVQPRRPGSWHEEMTVEGKLVFYSHPTGPGGSLEWTARYFPRREYWYYISQYPANPSLDPLMDLLLGFRPFIINVPGEIMEEVFDYLFSKPVAEPGVDATSVPLPPSRPESPDGPTQIGMIEVSINIVTPVCADSCPGAFVASPPSDSANADTNWAETDFFPLPLQTPARQRRNSTSNLQTCHAKDTTFSHPRSQRRHSTGRMSIASQQIEVPTDIPTPVIADSGSENFVASTPPDTASANTTYTEADFFPLPLQTPARQRCNSTSNLQTCHAKDTTFSHPRSQRRHSTGRMSIASQQIEVPTDIPTPVIADPGSEVFVTSTPPDTVNANTTYTEADFFPLPLQTPARQRRNSTSNLQTCHAKGTTFSHSRSQRRHSTGRMSIASQQIAVPTDIPTPVIADSGSEVFVASTLSDTANANTTYTEAYFFPLALRTPAPHRRKSTCNLQTCYTNPTTFSRPLSQRRHSTGCMSITSQQIEVPTDIPTPVIADSGSEALATSAPSDTGNANTTYAETNFFPPPLRTPASHRRKSTSHLQTCHTNPTAFSHPLSQRRHSTGPELRHPPQHRGGSGMELERDDRADANINEVANPTEEDGTAGESNSMPKEKFKYRRGGKRLTARKNRQRKQDEDQGNPEAGPSSAN